MAEQSVSRTATVEATHSPAARHLGSRRCGSQIIPEGQSCEQLQSSTQDRELQLQMDAERGQFDRPVGGGRRRGRSVTSIGKTASREDL
jgi:hypothetical protein